MATVKKRRGRGGPSRSSWCRMRPFRQPNQKQDLQPIGSEEQIKRRGRRSAPPLCFSLQWLNNQLVYIEQWNEQTIALEVDVDVCRAVGIVRVVEERNKRSDNCDVFAGRADAIDITGHPA